MVASIQPLLSALLARSASVLKILPAVYMFDSKSTGSVQLGRLHMCRLMHQKLLKLTVQTVQQAHKSCGEADSLVLLTP